MSCPNQIKKSMSKKNRVLTKNAENETELLHNHVLDYIEKIDGNKNIIERENLSKIIWKIFYDKSNNLHKIGPKKSSKAYVKRYVGKDVMGQKILGGWLRNRRTYLDREKLRYYIKVKVHYNCTESREIKILREWIDQNKNTFISALVIDIKRIS